MDSQQCTKSATQAASAAHFAVGQFGTGATYTALVLILLGILGGGGILLRPQPAPPSAAPATNGAHSASAVSGAAAITTGHTPHVAGASAFVAAMLPYARQAAPVMHWPVSLILAQWMIETGRPYQVPTANGYNLGNVRSFPGCQERQTRINGEFCYAPTMEEGLREYEGTAANGYYNDVSPAAAYGSAHGGIVAGAQDAARALGASPWDAGRYDNGGGPGSILISVLNQFDLYRYDQ